MNLFFFGKTTSETTRTLLSEIKSLVSGDNLEIFNSVSSLAKRLRQINASPDIFILSPSSGRELSELVDKKELLSGRPIILVLPDRSGSTIDAGHLLMPRFLTFRDNNLSDVADVLEKIQASRFTESTQTLYSGEEFRRQETEFRRQVKKKGG